MTQVAESREAAVLDIVLPNLVADGYEVFREPSKNLIPKFMKNYRPDAIAIKLDKKIAIEVVSKGGSRDRMLGDLHSLFSQQSEWELQVIYVPQRQEGQAVEPLSKPSIQKALDRVIQVHDTSGDVAGILTGWSVLEATARLAEPLNFTRPQPSARLVEFLASQGYVTPDEAGLLRSLGRLRNAASHGSLDLSVDRQSLVKLVAITQGLLDMAKPEGQEIH